MGRILVSCWWPLACASTATATLDVGPSTILAIKRLQQAHTDKLTFQGVHEACRQHISALTSTNARIAFTTAFTMGGVTASHSHPRDQVAAFAEEIDEVLSPLCDESAVIKKLGEVSGQGKQGAGGAGGGGCLHSAYSSKHRATRLRVSQR